MIHIGKEIEKEIERQGLSKICFAAKLGCERSNVYKIFARQSLDSALLLRISCILNHDFFVLYRDLLATNSDVDDFFD